MFDLKKRPRRLRKNDNLRRLVSETSLSAENFIMPYFVRHGNGIRNEIRSMPGNFQLSIDNLLRELDDLLHSGVRSIILFGIPERKDEMASEAYDDRGIIQQAITEIKRHHPDLTVVGDVCLCEYTNHGHCGVANGTEIDNDRTLPFLSQMAVAQAGAGVDIVAPSDMMDGRVAAIRSALDEGGFKDLPIMSYAAKYASAFYGPFREAAEGAPKFGDRSSYQMDIANSDEALREVALDIEEGADIVMVKPALAYLDVIRRVKDTFHIPVAAYNVSGEFCMIKAAAANGWLDHDRIMLEVLTSIKRAGANIIITYFAKEAARLLALQGSGR